LANFGDVNLDAQFIRCDLPITLPSVYRKQRPEALTALLIKTDMTQCVLVYGSQLSKAQYEDRKLLRNSGTRIPIHTASDHKIIYIRIIISHFERINADNP
jgi:hypothetical protein